MNITIVGASGYGNTGDDIYALVFKKCLSEHNVTIKNSDSPRKINLPCDLLIIGGGGLIYEDQTAHFHYMKDYMQFAIENNIPYMLISVGIQSTFLEWIPYFRAASRITVRSELDAILLDRIADIKAEYYPDLVYLFDECVEYPVPKLYTLFIPANLKSTKRWEPTFKQITEDGRIILRMCSKQEFIPLRKGFEQIGPCTIIDDATPAQCNYIISHAGIVLTHRYHGIILSRKHKIACNYIGSWSAKILHELCDRRSKPQAEAIGHITTITSYLAKRTTTMLQTHRTED